MFFLEQIEKPDSNSPNVKFGNENGNAIIFIERNLDVIKTAAAKSLPKERPKKSSKSKTPVPANI